MQCLLEDLGKVSKADDEEAVISVLGRLEEASQEQNAVSLAESLGEARGVKYVKKLRGHRNGTVRQKSASLIFMWEEVTKVSYGEDSDEGKYDAAGSAADAIDVDELPSDQRDVIDLTAAGSSPRKALDAGPSLPATPTGVYHYQARVAHCFCPCCKLGFKGNELPVDLRFPVPAVCEEIVEPTGLTTVGFRIFDQHRRARLREDADLGLLSHGGSRGKGEKLPPRIGTMVAANSGRPAGACGLRGRVAGIHGGYSTQEEDVFSNWMITEGGADPQRMNSVYRATIDQKWGLVDCDGANTATFQGVDYTAEGSRSNPSASVYKDAWVVRDCRLSVKTLQGGRTMYDASRQYPTVLVFCAGPNAGACPRLPSSSQRRTFCAAAAKSYQFFRAAVKAAMGAGLRAMASEGCEVALLARLSCGIYAGRHRKRINAELRAVVDELLLEGSLGRCFSRVIITNLS